MRGASIQRVRDLNVWQHGVTLAEAVYAVTKSFPKEERFGLRMQLRRSAASVPSNVAEGWGRASTKKYVRFLRIALGSLAAVETQLIIAHRLGYMHEHAQQQLAQDIVAESTMLVALIRSLRRRE